MLDADGRHSLLRRAIETFCADYGKRQTDVDRFGDDVINTAVDPRLLNDTVTEVDENVRVVIRQHRETVRNSDSLMFFWPIHCSVT